MVEIKGEVYPKEFSVVYRGSCFNVSKEGDSFQGAMTSIS